MEQTCEWMWGDLTLGGYVGYWIERAIPLNWSGTRTMAAAKAELEEELKKAKDKRKVIVKVPAQVGNCVNFDSIEEAISYLSKPVLTAEWMFGDHAFGHGIESKSPFNWSGTLVAEAAVKSLRDLSETERKRPVVLKMPAGVFSPERHFATAELAAEYIRRAQARTEKEAFRWAARQSSQIPEGKIKATLETYKDRVPLLDHYNSVHQAVDELNARDSEVCPTGMCIIKRKGKDDEDEYMLLYRADKQTEVDGMFGRVRSRTFAEMETANLERRAGFLAQFMPRAAGDGDDEFSKFFDSSKLVQNQVGTLTTRYTVGQILGEPSATGVIKKVTRNITGQEYVSKEPNEISNYPMVRVEAEKFKLLRHPNCARLVEVFQDQEDPERPILIIELARGGHLNAYMATAGRRDEELVLPIFKQAMCGVSYMHNHNYVHNDLKPENVLAMTEYVRGEVPRVVLTDYGCSKCMSDPKESQIEFGDIRYYSPESLQHRLDFETDPDLYTESDTSYDVWAMGVTLYELLSCKFPYIYEEFEHCAVFKEDPAVFERFKECIFDKARPLRNVSSFKECGSATEQTEVILRSALNKTQHERITAQGLIDLLNKHSKIPKRPETKVCLRVQAELALQLLLNALIWRLPFNHVKACQELFEACDTTNDGTIQRMKFKQIVTSAETGGLSEADADAFFDAADINGDNVLEFNEFAAISCNWSAIDAGVLKAHADELLQDISTEKQVTCTKADLKQYFGQAVSDEALAEFLLRLEVKDDDQLLKAEHICAFLKNYDYSRLRPIEFTLRAAQ